MAEFPALPLWTDAYLGDTTHLTTMQHGAYLLLLFTAWRISSCDLPDDDHLLARYTRMSNLQWQRNKPVIMAYWTLQNGRWFNKRLLDELDSVRRNCEQKKLAGRASALKRKHRNATAVAEPLNGCATPTPTPTPSKKKDISVAGDFDGFWALCPRKVGLGAARRAYAKAMKIATAEAIAAGMRRYASSRRGEEEKFTAHPATWLNGERWLDGGKGGPSLALVMSDEERQAEQDALRKVGL